MRIEAKLTILRCFEKKDCVWNIGKNELVRILIARYCTCILFFPGMQLTQFTLLLEIQLMDSCGKHTTQNMTDVISYVVKWDGKALPASVCQHGFTGHTDIYTVCFEVLSYQVGDCGIQLVYSETPGSNSAVSVLIQLDLFKIMNVFFLITILCLWKRRRIFFWLYKQKLVLDMIVILSFCNFFFIIKSMPLGPRWS